MNGPSKSPKRRRVGLGCLVLALQGLIACGPSGERAAAPTASTSAPPSARPEAPPANANAAAPAVAAPAPAPDPYAVPPIGPTPACALPAPGAADRATITALRAGTAPLTDADRLVAGCNATPADIASAIEHGALAHHRAGEFDVSATWFAKAAAIDPSSLGVRFNLMCALSRLDRIDAAYVHLDALRAAGAAGERFVARVETDPDLAAVRVDPRYYENRTVDSFERRVSEGETPEGAVFVFGPGATQEIGPPVALTAIVPPAAAANSPFQISRIPWGTVRDELGLPRTSELELASDETIDLGVGEPLSALVRLERPTFWRPLGAADSPTYLVVPEWDQAHENSAVTFYRIADGTARVELRLTHHFSDDDPTEPPSVAALGRTRAGTSLYFWNGVPANIPVSEVAYSGGRVRSRYGLYVGEWMAPVPAEP